MVPSSVSLCLPGISNPPPGFVFSEYQVSRYPLYRFVPSRRVRGLVVTWYFAEYCSCTPLKDFFEILVAFLLVLRSLLLEEGFLPVLLLLLLEEDFLPVLRSLLLDEGVLLVLLSLLLEKGVLAELLLLLSKRTVTLTDT